MSDDPYGERQIEILRSIHGVGSPQVAARLAAALGSAIEKEDWSGALSLGRDLLRIHEQTGADADQRSLRALHAVGLALARRGEQAEARVHLSRAVELSKRLGVGETERVVDLLALARVLEEEDELARARSRAEEALTLLSELPDPPAGLDVDAQTLLMELCAKAGDSEAVIERIARARLGAKSGPGVEVRRQVGALEQAARDLLGRERFDRAMEAVQAALSLLRELAEGHGRESSPAREEPDRGGAANLSGLLSLRGSIQRKAGQLQAARESWEEALTLTLASHEEQSSEVAVILNNLGALCWDLDLLDLGYQRVRKANRIFCELHGFMHPHTQASGRACMRMLRFLEESRRGPGRREPGA